MEIKRVDDRPMVIHTKEKPKLHVKGTPETKIRGRNVLTVQHGPKIAGAASVEGAAADGKIKIKKSPVHVAGERKTGQAGAAAKDRNGNVQAGNAQGRNTRGNVQDRNAGGNRRDGNVQTGSGAERFRDTGGNMRVQAGNALAGNGAAHSGGTGGGAQGIQQKGREIRQLPDCERRIHARQTGLARYRRTKAEKEAAVKKKPHVSAAVVPVAARAALDEMEGGQEVHDAYMAAATLAKPATDAVDAGRKICRSKAVREKGPKIRKIQPGSHIRGKTANGNAAGTAGKTAKAGVRKTTKAAVGGTAKKTGKKAAKETTKKAAKTAAKTAVKTAAATAGTGAGGALAGVLVGEAAGIKMDRRDIKNSTRSRMIKLFLAKLRHDGSQDNQDSIGKALKDIAWMRFSMVAKYIVRYVGLFLLALFAVVALIALPIIAVIAVIYNSPFAIFFPSISSGETIQEVLTGYVSDFNDAVGAELTDHAGYDTSEKIYVDYEGSGTPDNFCDILMVYMVKHGDGDTATDMTDAAKQNLKAVFDDMCSYTVTSRTDTESDDEGNETATTVKEVNVKLKSCYDMVSAYGFNAKQEEVLAQLMDPQYLAQLGYAGGGGGGNPGEAVSPEQYQAVVDAISDENGRKVVAFALSKVGYPYSQAYRDSGNYYDCSSLAYYAWQSAGVSILYGGSNTAASEGKYCYDNSLLVEYGAMQPGDLIFYSYERNGRFMDISHVAIYAGDGKVVEAANTRLGVVYRPVQGISSIVFIGRPR